LIITAYDLELVGKHLFVSIFSFGLTQMYRGLVASGGILAVFGAFLVFTDLYVPLGVSIFGLPILIAGAIMFVLGFFRGEPQPVEPEPGKKFCWYCMVQIPKDVAECPSCSLPQHDARD
jgi:hypothetical protein